jgi:hypothetical protein
VGDDLFLKLFGPLGVELKTPHFALLLATPWKPVTPVRVPAICRARRRMRKAAATGARLDHLAAGLYAEAVQDVRGVGGVDDLGSVG